MLKKISLGLPREHHQGKCGAERAEDEAGKERFEDGTTADFLRERVREFVEEVEEEADCAAGECERDDECDFVPADADVMEMRQAFSAAEEAAQEEHDTERACRHEEVEDGFGEFEEFEFNVGKQLIATAKDGCGETKERRAEYGGEYRGGAE